MNEHDLINEYLDDEVKHLLNKTNSTNREILVLSGGATKGVAQLGAMHCLNAYSMLSDIKTVAGTSAGAMIGMLFCAGYQPYELYKFISLIDLNMVKKLDTQNVITKYGLDDGSRMMLVLKKLLLAKGFNSETTFKEFYKKTKIKFIVTGACINDKKVYYFSYFNNPNMKVLEAVRISISIPILFTPCVYEGKVFVDGGCINNFPIDLFKDQLDKVIGIHVSETKKTVDNIKYIDDYLSNVVQCLFEGGVYKEISNQDKCVIMIKCTKPGETLVDVANMFDEGYVTTDKKIQAGDFNKSDHKKDTIFNLFS